MQSPYPLWQQMLFISFGPPTLALLFWLLANGRPRIIQRGTLSDQTKAMLRKAALAMMLSGWIVGFGVLIVSHYFPNLLPRSTP